MLSRMAVPAVITSSTMTTSSPAEKSLKSGSMQEQMIVEVANQFKEINENVYRLSEDAIKIEKAINDLSNANAEIVSDITTLSAVTEEVTACAQQSAEMTEGNYQSANDAKEILESILTTSHEIDKYIV